MSTVSPETTLTRPVCFLEPFLICTSRLAPQDPEQEVARVHRLVLYYTARLAPLSLARAQLFTTKHERAYH